VVGIMLEDTMSLDERASLDDTLKTAKLLLDE
jgi:hypothetical protein